MHSEEGLSSSYNTERVLGDYASEVSASVLDLVRDTHAKKGS